MIGARVFAAAALLAALLAAGCGGREKSAATPPAGGSSAGAPAAAPATAAADSTAGAPAFPGISGANLAPQGGGGPSSYQSAEGRFSVRWPLGCALIHTRVIPKGVAPEKLDFVAAGCDLYGKKGDGAAVTAYFKLKDPDGGPAGPRAVTAKIEELARLHNLQIIQQRPVRSGSLEGVRVFCRDASGPGIMWIQGVLYANRVYLLSAWRSQEGGLTDAAIAQFFQSFRVEGMQ